VPLGQILARPSCTVAWGPRAQSMHGPQPRGARPAITTLVRPVCTARGLCSPGRPRPVRPATARHSVAPARVVTALGRASRRGRRRCHSGRGGANGGGRAPTTLRLPAGHAGGENSSPELLVDGEGKKSGSTVAFF
jgi:hypothetical protein